MCTRSHAPPARLDLIAATICSICVVASSATCFRGLVESGPGGALKESSIGIDQSVGMHCLAVRILPWCFNSQTVLLNGI